MIARLWHGWTKPENANEYESLLRTAILPDIHRVSGYNGAWLMRRRDGQEVEFITLTFWDSWDAIREFAGDDHAHSVVPDAARKLLLRFEEKSIHYDGTWVP